ncbi:putative ferric-chelate reductase 1, partial [Stegodyphus mimosarum]
MKTQRISSIIINVLLIFASGCAAFPSGATVEACDSLLPRHLHTKPRELSESPYVFIASASSYYPDSKRRKIKVKIRGAPFKGFFVVALDADTHERTGTFLEANGMQPVPCSAVTHTDGRPKLMATMLWQPPKDKKSGEVIFLATILESFSIYYSGIVASVPVKKMKKRNRRETLFCNKCLFDHRDIFFKNFTTDNSIFN